MILRKTSSLLKRIQEKLEYRELYNKKVKPLGVPYDDFYSRTHEEKRGNKKQTSLFGKTVYRVDVNSYISCLFPIFFDNVYSFKTESKTPVILDCGANIGLSILYFKHIYPNAHIIGFEADKDIYNICNKNMESFGLKNVELINAAVWNTDGYTYFSNQSDSLGGHIADENTGVKVKTINLKSYLNKYETIDFLKIDIEGAEYEVMTECKDSLSNVKNMFLEFHGHSDKEQILDTVLKILKDAKFRYYIKEDMPLMNNPYMEYNNKKGIFDIQLQIFAYRPEN